MRTYDLSAGAVAGIMIKAAAMNSKVAEIGSRSIIEHLTGTGLDHNFGQRCLVRTADPTIRPRSVGSAVRTNDLAAGAVAGIMTKAQARGDRAASVVLPACTVSDAIAAAEK